MPRESQATRINMLAEVVSQLALHLKVMASILVPGSEEIQAHMQQLSDIAQQVADNQAPRFDLSPQTEEVA